MQTITILTPEWQRWLDENLRQGCSEASMTASMLAAGVDPAVARQWMRDARGPQPAADVRRPEQRAADVVRGYVRDTVRLPQAGHRVRTSDRDVTVAMRMSQPVIALFDNLLSVQECDELVRLSGLRLKRSTIVDPQTGEQRFIDDRSSDGTYFLLNETPFIAGIDRRISELLHWPSENGEGLQILRYGVGGEYKPHFDYFAPDHPGSQEHLARGGQRVSTMIMYLSDVAQGGETVFPAINLRVVPRKGSAVYFEYCNSSRQVDPLTLHGGTPVVAGEKWIATKWMRERRYA